MLNKVAPTTGSPNHFDLKNQTVDLFDRDRDPQRANISLADLEAMRAHRPPVPASKHGLEAICGASCETGAQ